MKKEKAVKPKKEKVILPPNDDAKYEREDSIICSDGDRRPHVSTFRRTTITKMERIGEIPVYVNESSGEHRYILEPNQLSFRKKSSGANKRVMSEEQKKATAQRFSDAREAKKNGTSTNSN